jgi:segregation and condensation protein B
MHSLSQQLRLVAGRNHCRAPQSGALPFATMPGPLPRRVLIARGRSAAERKQIGRESARRSRLEAVLFLAREPLSVRKLAQLSNLTDGTEARTLLSSLQKCYGERGCAFQVVQVAGGYQLLSRAEFANWLRPLAARERAIRLTPPALETLAVVAYRQPVLRAEVEAIRGVACGEILRQLMDRDLLRIVGRSEELGRPLSYGTTKRFLQAFGLSNLDQLPWASRLRRLAVASADDSLSQAIEADAHLTGDLEAA